VSLSACQSELQGEERFCGLLESREARPSPADGRVFSGKLLQKLAQFCTRSPNRCLGDIEALLCLFAAEGQHTLLDAWLGSSLQRLPRSGERVALVVHQLFDTQSKLHFPATIKPLACSTLIGLEAGELGLPEAKNVRLYGANTGYIPNAKVKAVGNFPCGGLLLSGYL
jgi:hypothetical protein